MPHVNNLTLTTFIKNYNSKYSQNISEEQQKLLNKYILSFSDNGLEFKAYLNEEIARLKTQIAETIEKEEVASDGDLLNKFKEVQSLLESFNKARIDQKLIGKVLKIQGLIREANE